MRIRSAVLSCVVALSAAAQEAPPARPPAGLPLAMTRSIKFTTDEGTWLDLDVTPDGRTIVFELVGDLYTMPIAGGKATRITDGAAYDAQPRISPDGRQIVFISDRDGNENLWIANLDGSRVRQFTRGENARYQSPVWTRDGRIVTSKGRTTAGPLPSRQYDQRTYDLVLYDTSGGSGVRLNAGTGTPPPNVLGPDARCSVSITSP